MQQKLAILDTSEILRQDRFLTLFPEITGHSGLELRRTTGPTIQSSQPFAQSDISRGACVPIVWL